MRSNGSIMRAMGRRRSEASPSSVADIELPASRPSSSRIVVPEFAQSRFPWGVANERRPAPRIRAVRSLRWMSAPRARRQATVARTSSPSGRPWTQLSPSARVASIRARWAIDLSPGTASSPAARAAGETVRADWTSASGMDALPEKLADALATLDALAVVTENVGKVVDRLDQRATVRDHDVLVERRVTLGQAHHAPKPGAAKLRIGKGPYRLGVRSTDRESQVAQKRHLPVVRLGGENLRPRAQGPDESEPFVEGREVLSVVRCENPGLAAEQRGIALTEAAAFLAGHRVAAEESIRIRESAGPLNHWPLHAGDVGDDRASPDDAGQAFEDRADLVDRRGDHDDVAIGQVTQLRRRPVDHAALLRRQHAIVVVGDTADLDGPAQPAQGQAERAANQTEADDADPHHATPTVRFSAAATASTCSTRWANACGVSDWAPSESATSGCACTSTISPSAPAAIPASAIGVTSERRPVPWLGSTITGRWLSSLIRGTALRSSVLRV